MSTIQTNRALTPADDVTSQTWTFSFMQSGVTISASLVVTIAPPPLPLSVVLNPTDVMLSDNAPAGTQITTATFSGGDGTAISMTGVNPPTAPVTFVP